LFAMLVGRPPFEAPDVQGTYSRIRAMDWCFPDSAAISPEARDLVARMLARDPAQRATLREVQQHAFFAGLHSSARSSGCGQPGADAAAVADSGDAAREVSSDGGG
jgi:serine/threonine protein kinase